MLDIPAVGLFVLAWIAFYAIHFTLSNTAFKLSRLYKTALKECRLTITFFQIRWYTTFFNRCLVRMGRMIPNAMHIWFTMGVVFGAAAMVSSVGILVVMLQNSLLPKENSTSTAVLVPVMPGMNLPWNQVGYYFIALALSGIIHELGHALASVRENVRINGCGLFFLFVYPGAFVELSSDHLSVISPIRQLRIVCAGVWHNLILALVFLVFWWLLPILLPFGYDINMGAVITEISVNSPLAGVMTSGETITGINDCEISSVSEWTNCIEKIQKEKSHGYCNSLLTISRKNISLPYLILNNEGNFDCCNISTQTHYCFSFSSFSAKKGHACLPARTTTTSKTLCHNANDCGVKLDSTCVTPLRGNISLFMRLKRKSGDDVILITSTLALSYTVTVSDYLPKYRLSFLWLPEMFQKMFMYIVSFSGALAILNVTPCYGLDGYWALNAFVDFLFSKYIRNVKTRNMLCNCILIVGTLLLMSNIIIALITFNNNNNNNNT